MSILTQLEQDIKEAMKARQEARLGAVRLIKSTVKNKEIELIRPLSEAEFFYVLSNMGKQRRDSIEQFEKANRMDLVAKEKSELEIIESYLPKRLSDEELTAVIEKTIQATGAKGAKDMGVVMKALKAETSGRVDGKTLADRVKSHLS